MRDPERSVAMAEAVDTDLRGHLLRADHQEDLTFALWTPSSGATRETALLHTVVPPLRGDRQVRGNVSFNPAYVERVTALAAREKCGVAFLHSHPGPGWQGMSRDDVAAETKLAGPVGAITGLPLVGLTAGSDGTWSARAWPRTGPGRYERSWCRSVRVVGMGLRADFADHLAPAPGFREMFRRTVTVWGEAEHANLARLRVGVVGLGSVGSIVAEALARMGLAHLALIDFDEVQPHNLDRLLAAGPEDVGALKVDVAARALARSSTAASIDVRLAAASVAEEAGYRAALDCDVLFSCVDRPRARGILNHLAYAHLIPVIDGGIAVRFKGGHFAGVDWQLQTVAPGRACLQCLGAFDPSDVSAEREGRLDDPSYLAGLPADHRFKRNENVFPFSANLASLEVLQFVALATGIAKMPHVGVQRYRYMPGTLEADPTRSCRGDCENITLTAQGDRHFTLWDRDLAAEVARLRQSSSTGRTAAPSKRRDE